MVGRGGGVVLRGFGEGGVGNGIMGNTEDTLFTLCSLNSISVFLCSVFCHEFDDCQIRFQ